MLPLAQSFLFGGGGGGGGGGYIFTLKNEFENDLHVLVGLLSNDLLATWFERRGDMYQSYYIGADKKILNEAPVLLHLLDDEIKMKIRAYVNDLFECSDEEDSFYKETLNSLNFEVDQAMKVGES